MSNEPGTFTACGACAAKRLNLCAGMRHKPSALPATSSARTLVQSITARRVICGPREWSEFVHVICSGWAMVSTAMADGRRQTLAFLLPGEIDSTASLFQPRFGRTIEAITEVFYRRFRREEMRDTVLSSPDLLRTLGELWSAERAQADDLAIDLGRRTADERIARLILDLGKRLALHGMVQEQTMDFPLRQRQIADATGLTAVHVSRVLNEFQRNALIRIGGRKLTILDYDQLRRLAEA
ncbi:MAG: Crp/Fnr family transcriptional regulator [Bradyrhizobiaceae bacterium]|nr:Crp/Fnr family transcriptional regulator [Bradyrhizobiaceae bacterium]